MGRKFYKEVFEPEFEMVYGFFKDVKKTLHWFNAANPLLGGLKPLQMFYPKRRRDKLNRFIKQQLEDSDLEFYFQHENVCSM